VVAIVDSLQEFEIDRKPIWPADDPRLEPILLAGPLWIEFEEPEPPLPTLALGLPESPIVVGFEESAAPGDAMLDPDRAMAGGDAPTPAGPAPSRASAAGLVGSLAVHLSPLLLLLGWTGTPVETPPPIPVQLVFEAPNSPLADEQQPPVSGPLSSESVGEPAAPAAPQLASALPPPKTPDPPTLPDPPKELEAAIVPPPSKPVVHPPPKPAPAPAPPTPAPAVAPMPQPPAHPGRVPGPDATRDEYLAYLVVLTRQHLDLLPASLVAGRRGETLLSVRVLGDGTIARIAVTRGSGYPDIDARIEQMVAAVRRFPPLPPWFQGPVVDLNLRMRFPEALAAPEAAR